MGLFDMFGAGGGRLQIQPQSPHVAAGSSLAGAVGFQGGSRAQQITNITLKLVMEQTQMEPTPQGPQQRTHTRDVIPAFPVTGAFTSTPGQVQQFPFNFQLPAGLPNSTPGLVKYRLVASADIDGEIDPGANVEIQVVGGTQPAMAAPGMMAAAGMMPGGMPMGGVPMPGGGMPMGGMPMGGMPMQPAPIQIGANVMAQWQDGQWHPGRVVAMQNGMIGVDWANPALGASSWLYPQQVQAQPMGPPAMAPGMMAPGMGVPMGKPMDPGMHKPMDPGMHKPMDPGMHKHAHDPYGKDAHHHHGNAPQGKGMDPMHAKGAMPMGGGVHIGQHVLAQWQDGSWHPGRVVAMQNGMVGVDWDNPKLGQSSWVQPSQVRAK